MCVHYQLGCVTTSPCHPQRIEYLTEESKSCCDNISINDLAPVNLCLALIDYKQQQQK